LEIINLGGVMGQSEILKLLEKEPEPLPVGIIAKKLEEDQKKISKLLSKLLQFNEVDFLEIDRLEAMDKYKCKRRLRLWFIKGVFMATVDLATGKIFGCSEGSKVWYHEKAHILFNNTNLGSKVSYYQFFFMMISVFFLSLYIMVGWKPLAIFSFVNALGMIFSYLYEEIWCWVVGLSNYYRKK
jgi:hypothetical protein